MESDKIYYIVILPDENFENIKKPGRLELTAATTPKSAASNIIARNAEGQGYQKVTYIKKAIGELKNKHIDIGTFSYEVPVGIFDKKDGDISRNDPLYKTSMEVFLANEIAKRNNRDPIDCLEDAKEGIGLYLDRTKKQ